ncbi:YraN family protein, partial [Aliarcobacter butzleri]
SQKLSKIKRSVDIYIQKNNLDISYSKDVIIVVDDKIVLLENITM